MTVPQALQGRLLPPMWVPPCLVWTRSWAAEGPRTPELPPQELCMQFDKVQATREAISFYVLQGFHPHRQL